MIYIHVLFTQFLNILSYMGHFILDPVCGPPLADYEDVGVASITCQ